MDEHKGHEKGDSDAAPSKSRRTLRVDQLWSRKDRQWHFVKTAKAKQQDRFRKYTLVVRRVISAKGMLAQTEVDIKSPKLTELLMKIFEGVDGLKLTSTPPMLEPKMFFHAFAPLREKLEQEAAKSDPDKEFMEDIAISLDFLQEEFVSTAANLDSLLKHGDITYDLLWAIFPPQAQIFTHDNILKEPQALKFASGSYEQSQEGNYYFIEAKIIHHDGQDFGWADPSLKISAFEGAKKIASLPVYPLRYHAEPDRIREVLVERGRKFVALLEPLCREYRDVAVHSETEIGGNEAEKRFNATGRIMVDPAAFRAQVPGSLLRLPWVRDNILADTLGDDDLLVCNHRILGFSFSQKKWGSFAMSKMSDVIWNEAAFDKLILEEKKRKMISMLVKSHKTDDEAFDDIVSGKGKGLVGLLSGSPGVGKTLTAEVVAELSRRPLYIVSAGELGTSPGELDDQLGMVLDITRRWGCVLLIDEADVLLYKRGEAQLERNAVVSIFLRRLEYFHGIVILTTNRRQDIDEAFKSRIHFKFHYPPLTEDGRYQIWKNFLSSIPGTTEVSEADLSGLAKQPMNGREIKNAVSCSLSIVRASKEPLTVQLIKDILESLVEDWDVEEE